MFFNFFQISNTFILTLLRQTYDLTSHYNILCVKYLPEYGRTRSTQMAGLPQCKLLYVTTVQAT